MLIHSSRHCFKSRVGISSSSQVLVASDIIAFLLLAQTPGETPREIPGILLLDNRESLIFVIFFRKYPANSSDSISSFSAIGMWFCLWEPHILFIKAYRFLVFFPHRVTLIHKISFLLAAIIRLSLFRSLVYANHWFSSKHWRQTLSSQRTLNVAGKGYVGR